MPKFWIEYVERAVVSIEADSESAARQAWIEGDYDSEQIVGSNIEKVTRED